MGQIADKMRARPRFVWAYQAQLVDPTDHAAGATAPDGAPRIMGRHRGGVGQGYV